MKRSLLPCALLLAVGLSQAQTFTKVADAANSALNFVNDGRPYKGVSWVDINDDNLPDLFVSQRHLFRNLGGGNFEQLPLLDGVNSAQLAGGSSWGDLNNDGLPDCITASYTAKVHYQNADGSFSTAADLPGMANYPAWDCALADADNNGLLDLLFVHAQGFHLPSSPFPCRFYLQTTPGNFSQVTGYEFTDQLAPFTIPIWSDYDLDGDMDLFIGSGPGGSAGEDYCYKNMLKENGSFSLQRIFSAPFNQLQDGQVYSFTDYDLDGDFDICLSNYGGATTRFYLRNADGSYSSQTAPFTQQRPFLANVWGDVDNDGDEDVLFTEDQVANAHLYRNNSGTFAAAQTAGSSGARLCGLAFADYDNDGDLDFYTNSAADARALFRNGLSGSNHWAQFALRGTASNRSGIGTLIRLKSSGTWQMRQVLAHNSFGGHSDLRQHFGLGAATSIDSVELRWPSGAVQQFSNLAADKFYKVTENQGIDEVSSSAEPVADIPVVLYPNPTRGLLFISSPVGIAAVEVFDTSGKKLSVQATRNAEGWQIALESAAAGPLLLELHFENGKKQTRLFAKQ
jgi:hypothetical protein